MDLAGLLTRLACKPGKQFQKGNTLWASFVRSEHSSPTSNQLGHKPAFLSKIRLLLCSHWMIVTDLVQKCLPEIVFPRSRASAADKPICAGNPPRLFFFVFLPEGGVPSSPFCRTKIPVSFTPKSPGSRSAWFAPTRRSPPAPKSRAWRSAPPAPGAPRCAPAPRRPGTSSPRRLGWAAQNEETRHRASGLWLGAKEMRLCCLFSRQLFA